MANLVAGLATGATLAGGAQMIYNAFDDGRFDVVDDMYKMLDTIDNMLNIYDTAQERENTINAAMTITAGNNLDPMDLLADLESLRGSGKFSSNEEAMAFDGLLRQLLQITNKSPENVDLLVPEIIAKSDNPNELTTLLSSYIDTESDFYTDIDGKAGISLIDLQNYLISQRAGITEAFGKLQFNPDDVEKLNVEKKMIEERAFRFEYYGVLTPEEYAEWISFSDVDELLNGFEYKEDENQNAYIARNSTGYSGGGQVPLEDIYSSDSEIYFDELAKYFELVRSSYKLQEDIYTKNAKTKRKESIKGFGKLKGFYAEEFEGLESSQMGPVEQQGASFQSSAFEASQTANQQTELNSEDLTTIENIDSNILKIYELMAGDSLVGVDGLETQEGSIFDSYSKYKELYGTSGQSDEDISNIEQIQSALAAIKNTIVGSGEAYIGQDVVYPGLAQNNSVDLTEKPVQDSLTNISTLLSNSNLTGQTELSAMLLNHGIDAYNNLLLIEIVNLLNKALSRPTNVNVTANIYNENDYNEFISKLTKNLSDTMNKSAEGVYA